jgi:predicted Zn-dependent protease
VSERLRPPLLAIALVVAAWFGLGIRQAGDTRDAAAIVSRLEALSPAQSAHAADLLDAAGTLNPDRHVEVLRAELALHHRDVPRARRLLEGVVADEPENIEAWALLAEALRRSDAAAARRAQAQVRRLAPPVPAP